jgi:hypothetical protein
VFTCRPAPRFQDIALKCFSNQCSYGKTISITHCECVFVALGIEHAMCIRRIVICGLPRSTTLSHKRYNSRETVTQHMMCVLISLQLLSETFFILRRTERDITKPVYRSVCFMQSTRYSCHVSMELDFPRRL